MVSRYERIGHSIAAPISPLRQSEANQSVRRMGSGRSRHPVSEAGLKNRSVAANRHYFVLAMNQATASGEAGDAIPISGTKKGAKSALVS